MTGNQPSPVPLVKGPGKTRLLLTFFCFVVLLTGAAAVLTRVLIVPSKPVVEEQESLVDIPKNPEQDWFYDAIGQGSSMPAEVAAPVKAENNYTLEIKLATSREEAEKIITMLGKMDVQAYYTPVSRNGRVLYRVRRGLFPNKTMARKAARELRDQKNVSTKIVIMQ